MAFADLLDQLGGMGRFQILQSILLCLPVLLMASHNLLQNFVAAVPPHYCSAHRNLSQSQLSPEEALLITVPLDRGGKPVKCRRYAAPQWHLLANNGTFSSEGKVSTEDADGVELQECTDGWSYDKTERSSSVISEWHLVCERRSLKQMGQTIYMGGVLVGAAVFGHLSDRVGRRVVLLISYLLMAVGGTCASFSASFSVFCVFRFMCGMALSGVLINVFSLIVEWIPTRTRTVVGTGIGYFYTTGQLILAVVAYFIRDWRWLTLAVSLPFYIFFIYAWWFLESARWLVLNKKSHQAVKNLKTVARINGYTEEGDKIDNEMLEESMSKEVMCSTNSHTALDLFRNPTMRKITLCLSAVWFSTSFGYYGLSMDLQKFGVDIYLIQVIFGAVDIPAKIMMTVSMSYIGRRTSQSAALILAGVVILINVLVPNEKHIVRTSMAVLGKGFLAASFNCCYLYSGELYPTVLRQRGLGLVSVMARFGAMVAPMVLLLGEYVPWLPGLIYGAAPVLSGVAAIFLPETLGVPLTDTIQEVEDRGSGRQPNKFLEKETISLKDNCDDLPEVLVYSTTVHTKAISNRKL